MNALLAKGADISAKHREDSTPSLQNSKERISRYGAESRREWPSRSRGKSLGRPELKNEALDSFLVGKGLIFTVGNESLIKQTT